MIYRIKTTVGDVVIESEEALSDFLAQVSKGAKLVITKYGVVNPAMIGTIVRDDGKMKEIRDIMQYGKTKEEATSEVLGVSPFAKLLGGKMQMLTPEQRTMSQEESGRRGLTPGR